MKMGPVKYFVQLIFCATAYASVKPKSVNVALETVLEFDKQDHQSDVALINKVQQFLDKVKHVMIGEKNARRSVTKFKSLKFSDFIREAINALLAYDDEDLEQIFIVLEDQSKKFHYKGCKFHELFENNDVRSLIFYQLEQMKATPAKEIRIKLRKLAQIIQLKKYNGKVSAIVDLINSLYDADQEFNFDDVIRNLQQYRSKSKRSNLELTDIIRGCLRSLVFDHYSSLTPNARRELKLRLDTFWHFYTNDLFGTRDSTPKKSTGRQLRTIKNIDLDEYLTRPNFVNKVMNKWSRDVVRTRAGRKGKRSTSKRGSSALLRTRVTNVSRQTTSAIKIKPQTTPIEKDFEFSPEHTSPVETKKDETTSPVKVTQMLEDKLKSFEDENFHRKEKTSFTMLNSEQIDDEMTTHALRMGSKENITQVSQMTKIAKKSKHHKTVNYELKHQTELNPYNIKNNSETANKYSKGKKQYTVIHTIDEVDVPDDFQKPNPNLQHHDKATKSKKTETTADEIVKHETKKKVRTTTVKAVAEFTDTFEHSDIGAEGSNEMLRKGNNKTVTAKIESDDDADRPGPGLLLVGGQKVRDSVYRAQSVRKTRRKPVKEILEVHEAVINIEMPVRTVFNHRLDKYVATTKKKRSKKPHTTSHKAAKRYKKAKSSPAVQRKFFKPFTAAVSNEGLSIEGFGNQAVNPSYRKLNDNDTFTQSLNTNNTDPMKIIHDLEKQLKDAKEEVEIQKAKNDMLKIEKENMIAHTEVKSRTANITNDQEDRRKSLIKTPKTTESEATKSENANNPVTVSTNSNSQSTTQADKPESTNNIIKINDSNNKTDIKENIIDSFENIDMTTPTVNVPNVTEAEAVLSNNSITVPYNSSDFVEIKKIETTTINVKKYLTEDVSELDERDNLGTQAQHRLLKDLSIAISNENLTSTKQILDPFNEMSTEIL